MPITYQINKNGEYMSAISFPRRPYNVTYRSIDGEINTIRRQPPKKLHDILPEDVVSLSYKKNDDWEVGEEFEVKNVNNKQPNTVQIKNTDTNDYTFVPYYDLKIEEKVNFSNYKEKRDIPQNNKYLRWP